MLVTDMSLRSYNGTSNSSLLFGTVYSIDRVDVTNYIVAANGYG